MLVSMFNDNIEDVIMKVTPAWVQAGIQQITK